MKKIIAKKLYCQLLLSSFLLLFASNNFTEILLNTDRTTLSTGINGQGKSTFIDAITFALYGKHFRKINKSGLINSIRSEERRVGKECE
jgi:DNA repair exonuclease SbcCD ATPase subunit